MDRGPTLMERLSGWSWRSGKAAGYEEIPSQDDGSMLGVREFNEDALAHNMLMHNHVTPAGRSREWLFVDSDGSPSLVVVDKHELVLELGVQYRDLRIVDPYVPTPYPAGIFLRDKAMVLNLESLRCIICNDRVYILSVPAFRRPLNHHGTALSVENFFVQDLINRVRPAHVKGLSPSRTSMDAHLPFELRALESALATAVTLLEIEGRVLERQTEPALKRLMQQVRRQELNTIRHSKTSVSKLLSRVTSIKNVLEGLLDDDEDMEQMYLGRKERQKRADRAAAAAKEAEEEEFSEGETIPEEDEFQEEEEEEQETEQPRVSNANAPTEPVATPFGHDRQQQQVAGSGSQGSTILSRRSAARHIPSQQTSGLATADSAPHPIHGIVPLAPSPADPFPMGIAMSAPATDMPSIEKKPSKKRKHGHWKRLQNMATILETLQNMNSKRRSSIHLADMLEDPKDITACESLLEAYFLQVDGLQSRMSNLEGRISYTEDQLNIEMDHRRNELQAFDLTITAFMSSLAFISMIGGIWGMNMKNGYEESVTAFYLTVGLTCVVAFGLLLGILMYAKRKRLLFIPTT